MGQLGTSKDVKVQLESSKFYNVEVQKKFNEAGTKFKIVVH